MDYLGIDIGFSAIKYGLVRPGADDPVLSFDLIAVSLSARCDSINQALKYILETAGPYASVGVGFPSRIWAGQILRTTIDFNAIWNGLSANMAERRIPCFALNDADAAGIAEIARPEAAELRQGTAILLTLGSGIGSAVFLGGRLLSNTELGAIQLHGMKAEDYAAPSLLAQEGLTLSEWAARLQEVLDEVEYILSPHHLVLGGGISAEFEQYRQLLHTRASLSPAYYRNQAGTIGAALFAAEQAQAAVP